MTVSLKAVSREDLRALFQLKVDASQQDFVAPNEITLAQVAYDPNAEVFGIWADDQLVGLTALIDTTDYPHLEDGDDPNSGFIWRLMIGHSFQGNGFGTAALHEISAWARGRELPKMYLSVVPENAAAIRVYEAFGYARTGRLVDGESEFVLDL